MYLQQDWKDCGVTPVDLEDDVGVMDEIAGATPVKFSATGTFDKLNCFLGKLWFIASDDKKNLVISSFFFKQ